MWPFRDNRIKLLTPPGIRATYKPFVQYGLVVSKVELVKINEPMCRVHYEDGTHSGWNTYPQKRKRIVAIETRVYAYNPVARSAMLKVG